MIADRRNDEEIIARAPIKCISARSTRNNIVARATLAYARGAPLWKGTPSP